MDKLSIAKVKILCVVAFILSYTDVLGINEIYQYVMSQLPKGYVYYYIGNTEHGDLSIGNTNFIPPWRSIQPVTTDLRPSSKNGPSWNGLTQHQIELIKRYSDARIAAASYRSNAIKHALDICGDSVDLATLHWTEKFDGVSEEMYPTTEEMYQVLEWIRMDHNVKKLSLTKIPDINTRIDLIGDTIYVCQELTHLNLSNCQLNTYNAKYLLEILSLNKVVCNIDISGNPISNYVMDQFKALELRNRTLIDSSLRDTARIYDLPQLIQKIAENDPRVVAVDLSSRGIADGYTQQLAEALKTNKLIRHIDLRNNGLIDESFNILIDVIKVHPSLKTVDIAGVDSLSLEAKERLQKVLAEKAK